MAMTRVSFGLMAALLFSIILPAVQAQTMAPAPAPTPTSDGCSNNNYASKEKCKKCGQPKEVAAMPAIAMPGGSLPTYAHYFSRAHGAPGLKMNFGMMGNSALQQSLMNPNWSLGGADKFGLQSASSWPLGGNAGSGFSFANNANQASIPKGWRGGDWICNCGFHNYSSRTQCKKCNASLPSGTVSSLVNTSVTDLFPNKQLAAVIPQL